MAQKTALSVMAIPGPVHNFVPKAGGGVSTYHSLRCLLNELTQLRCLLNETTDLRSTSGIRVAIRGDQ